MKRTLTIGALALVVLAGAAAPAAARPQYNVIVGTAGSDVLVGTRHNDLIYGRASRDLIVGRRGNDILIGNRGNDILWGHGSNGHSGSDFLRGGPGIDRCVGDTSDVFAASCETVIIREG